MTIAIVVVAPTGLLSQQSDSTSKQIRSVPRAIVSRNDLGLAYLRFEQALEAKPLEGAERIEKFNRDFDTATISFFSRRYNHAIKQINQLTSLTLSNEPSEALGFALSLKSTVDPPVIQLDEHQAARIQLQSIYSYRLAKEVSLKVLVEPVGGGRTLLSAPIPLDSPKSRWINTVVEFKDLSNLRPGIFSIVISDENGVKVVAGRMQVVKSSLDKRRARNEEQLNSIKTKRSNIRSAIAACKSRNSLLRDKPSNNNTTSYVSDLNALAKQVEREIEQLADGEDPYHRKTGDYWRTFRLGSTLKNVPVRIYCPPNIDGDKRVPLVVALHGAGGDENMFFSGMGAGKIKQLASERGFIVVAPSTDNLGSNPDRFDDLIKELTGDYNIDDQAIYLIGHSMGGFATVALASSRPETIAAACCIASGGKPASKSVAPLLFICGEYDSIVSYKRMKRFAEESIKAGMPVEFRSKALGHTLIVGDALPEAIDWLLKQKRSRQGK